MMPFIAMLKIKMCMVSFTPFGIIPFGLIMSHLPPPKGRRHVVLVRIPLVWTSASASVS